MITTAPALAPADRELVIMRVFRAPRERVFEAWTNPDHARQWWGPVNYPAAHLEMDARPGGTWRICLRSTEGGPDLWQHGTFREVVAPKRLAFTFVWEEEGERGLETLVTIDFVDQGGKTLMTFRQSPFQSVKERDGHGWGWNSAFGRLDERIADGGVSINKT